MRNSKTLPLIWLSSLAVALFVGFRTSSPQGEDRLASISGESSSDDGRTVNRKPSSSRGMDERLSDRDPVGSVDSAGWESLAEQMGQIADPMARRLAFNKLLGQLTPENAVEMHKRLAEFRYINRNELNVFNHAWGAISGQEAFDIAAQSSREDLGAIIGGWASTDPAGALAMLDGLPENLAGQRRSLERSVVLALSANDLPLAMDLAESYDGRYGKDGYSSHVMEEICSQVIRSQGREAAMVWAESLPDGRLKGQALNRIVQSLGERSPQAAAEWLGKFADQGYAAGAFSTATQEFAKVDPASTAPWLESLPEGKNRTEAFGAMMLGWARYGETADAADYLMEMPDSRERDSAVDGFSRAIGMRDPRTAIAWAEDISDPALRQKSLIGAAEDYRSVNPREMLDWLPTSGISEEEQQKLLSPR